MQFKDGEPDYDFVLIPAPSVIFNYEFPLEVE